MATIDPAMPQDTSSRRSPGLLSRKTKLTALVMSLLLFDVVGVFVRSNRGIRIVVENESGMSLKHADIILEHGGPYLLGEITAGTTQKIFIVPDTDSRIRAEFTDQNSQSHSEIVAAYVENGYCGDVTVRVLPNLTVSSHDDSFAMLNWKSWYGFL